MCHVYGFIPSARTVTPRVPGLPGQGGADSSSLRSSLASPENPRPQQPQVRPSVGVQPWILKTTAQGPRTAQPRPTRCTRPERQGLLPLASLCFSKVGGLVCTLCKIHAPPKAHSVYVLSRSRSYNRAQLYLRTGGLQGGEEGIGVAGRYREAEGGAGGLGGEGKCRGVWGQGSAGLPFLVLWPRGSDETDVSGCLTQGDR